MDGYAVMGNYRIPSHMDKVALYRTLLHFSLRIVDSNGDEVSNSGDIYDIAIGGGRIGVAAFNQSDIIWSNLVARCKERENLALYLNGVSQYVTLGNVSEYGIVERYYSF